MARRVEEGGAHQNRSGKGWSRGRTLSLFVVRRERHKGETKAEEIKTDDYLNGRR